MRKFEFLNETQTAVKELLESKGIAFEVVLTGELITKDDWLCDSWLIKINGQAFDYYTGIGHRVSTNFGLPKEFKGLGLYIKASKLTQPTRGENRKWGFSQWLKVPCAADVLYATLLDASLASESFEDFCSSCGYDTDSRKALETYLACQENGHKLRKAGIVGGTYAQIEALLEDY